MIKKSTYNLFTYNSENTPTDYRDDEPVYFLMGTPFHTNIGDRAIAHAEIDFIASLGDARRIIEVPFGEDISQLDIRESDVIVLHGGGNFGDIWPDEEEYRQHVVARYSQKKIVLMPQTMFFANEESLRKSVDVYSRCTDLTLIARENVSYEMMKRNFTKNSVELLPDIVLSLKPTRPFIRKKRSYALFAIRRDIEKTIPDSYVHRAEDVLRYEAGIDDFIYSDMHCDEREAMMNSHKFITEYKINQFKGAKIVVTDRLHGMVFAAITGTPCLVFGSKTQKTKGVYELLKQTKAGRHIHLCENEDDISDIINQLSIDNTYSGNINELKPKWARLSSILKI